MNASTIARCVIAYNSASMKTQTLIGHLHCMDQDFCSSSQITSLMSRFLNASPRRSNIDVCDWKGSLKLICENLDDYSKFCIL